MNTLTVKDLYVLCSRQISKGNDNKKIYISDDDEGNGYHALMYHFTDDYEDVKDCIELSCTHTYDDDIKDIVILG